MRIPLVGEQAESRRRTRPMQRRSRRLDTAVVVPPSARARTRGRDAQRSPLVPPAHPTTRRRTPAGSRRQVAVVPRRRVSWRAIARRLPVLLAAAAAMSALVYAFTDAQFFVYEGHIAGAQHLHPSIIYQAAGVHEQSIFWIDPTAVANRVMQVPGVKTARVRCELPARVVVTIEERQPRILWRALSQGRDWWVDDEGMVLPYHGDPSSSDVLFVVDYSTRELAIGQRVAPDELVSSVLSLAEAMPGVRLYTYDAERGLGFTQEIAGEQWPVYVGSNEDLARKVQIMQAMTAYLSTNNIHPRYVDVRWADRPVYGRPPARPVEDTTTEPGAVPSGEEE